MKDIEKNDKITKIILFISKDSIYFQVTMQEFQKLLNAFEQLQPFTHEVIDVTEAPEKAEEYKIDALPTLIIGDKRFIGQPDSGKILEMVQSDKK